MAPASSLRPLVVPSVSDNVDASAEELFPKSDHNHNHHRPATSASSRMRRHSMEDRSPGSLSSIPLRRKTMTGLADPQPPCFDDHATTNQFGARPCGSGASRCVSNTSTHNSTHFKNILIFSRSFPTTPPLASLSLSSWISDGDEDDESMPPKTPPPLTSASSSTSTTPRRSDSAKSLTFGQRLESVCLFSSTDRPVEIQKARFMRLRWGGWIWRTESCVWG
ncbi:hypothetical protein BC829DRAFT_42504 [Chytridium lagenaria]|nr:hypothetical protein BC829DRAFT_42504 [Chytridium lagenaria]